MQFVFWDIFLYLQKKYYWFLSLNPAVIPSFFHKMFFSNNLQELPLVAFSNQEKIYFLKKRPFLSPEVSGQG